MGDDSVGQPKLTPTIAFTLAKMMFEEGVGQDSRLEAVIANDTLQSYLYAKEVLRRPELVPQNILSRITQEAYYSYVYAVNVLGCRWPEAEPVIAADPWWAYHYALRVLERPWLEAEPVIAKNDGVSWMYRNDVLHSQSDRKRFDEIRRWAGQI